MSNDWDNMVLVIKKINETLTEYRNILGINEITNYVK